MQSATGIEALRSLTSLDDLQAAIAARNMTPGWIPRTVPIMWDEMRSAFVPAHWRYAEAKAAMQAAARLIGTDRAERRNFVMRNPIAGNDFATLRTLVCAYQTILPGEKARSHRHSSHALRVMLESAGSYSIVNGEKYPMDSGDIVLTPGWCWHGHGHDGGEQAYWFDGLDVPLTHLLEPMFFEPHPEGWESARLPPTAQACAVGTPDRPPTAQACAVETPGLPEGRSRMHFPWAETRAVLDHASSDPAGHFGRTIDLPAPVMPTLAIRVHAWPAGWCNRPYRHSTNTIYLVMQGHGRSTIGEGTFEWEFGDTLAAPAWTRIEHRASADAIVFAMSDENLMRWAGYYRLEAVTASP